MPRLMRCCHYCFRDKESKKLLKEMEKRAAAEAAAVSQGDNNARGSPSMLSAAPTTELKLGSQSKHTAVSFGFGSIKKRPNLGRGRGLGT